MKRRIIIVVTVLLALITLVQMLGQQFLGNYLSQQKLNNSSIAIIGGADGPTRIFVSSNYNQWLSLIPLIVTVIGIIYLVCTRNKIPKE